MKRINFNDLLMGPLFTFMVRRVNELNACGRYLLVFVYRDADGSDCTLNGVTKRFSQLYVPHPEGNYTRADINDPCQILKVIPPSFPGCPYRFRPECIDDGKHSMMGGNYVCTSDSRFKEEYGAPIAVHDRVE